MLTSAVLFLALACRSGAVEPPPKPVKIDGMYVNAYGDPKNQPVVFVHGGPGYDSQDFEFTTAEPLSKRGYYVVVYDQRGQGRSDVTDARNFNYRRYADDLKEIIDRLKLKDPVLIGHSHGGEIAVKFDEFYPRVAKKIVLVSSPIVSWDSMRSMLENCSRNYGIARRYDKQADIGEIYFQLFLDSATASQPTPDLVAGAFEAAADCGLYQVRHPSPAARELWRRYGKSRVKSPLAGELTAMPGFLANDNENYLHFDGLDHVFANRSRFCGIYGDEDGLFTPLDLSVIRNALRTKDAKVPFRIVHGASHDVFVDQQAEFFQALQETCGLK